MKRLLVAFSLSVVLAIVLFGCKQQSNQSKEKPLILTTIYPYELIVRELVDTLFNVETLLPPNASPHTWSPSPQDMLKLQKADVVISNGLGLETNLSKALSDVGSKHIIAASLIDEKKLLSEAEYENHENHEHEAKAETDEHHHDGPNPHIWTSPEFLSEIIIGLSIDLGKRYPMSKAAIESKARLMIMEINQVDGKIKAEKEQYPKAAIVTLHEAFAYYFEHFKIDYVGAVQPSAGKDPTPKQLQELADKIKLKKIKAIFIEPQMNPKPAETLAKELNLKVLKYDDLGTTIGAKTISEYLWLNWVALKAGF